MMLDWLYDDSFGVFVLVTLVLGGGTAWLSGRAIAATWRPWWHIVPYMLILGAAVRFIHFALFDATLLSPHYFVDSAICMVFAFFGFRMTRAAQMAGQYGFLFARTGPFAWARRPAATPNEGANSG